MSDGNRESRDRTPHLFVGAYSSSAVTTSIIEFERVRVEAAIAEGNQRRSIGQRGRNSCVGAVNRSTTIFSS